MIANNCYDRAALVPVFDVLKPGSEVQILGFTIAGQKMKGRAGEILETKENDIIVNKEFMLWVDSLKDEIKRLRDYLGE